MTRFLEDPKLQSLANEESVRGVLVRSVLEQAGEADEEERLLLEKSLRLLLKRFQAMPGSMS